jgi:hypothetical protein
MAGGLARLRGACALLLAATVIAGPAAAQNAGDAGGGSLSMEDLAASYQAWRLERAAERQSPAARDARERSRSVYVGQSAAQARETAVRTNPAFVAAPVWRPFTLPEGARVADYLGDYAASVELPDGQRTLVESTLPIRAESETGTLAPVDLSLVDSGGFFEPRTPFAELRLGKAASDGALLPGSGIGVAPRAAATVSNAVAVSDKAFYANVAEDSDYLAVPVAGGFQAAWQLRSPASPERLELDFELPAGAELRQAVPRPGEPEPVGGLEVVRGGERLATVSAPVAWDADGERVPATYALEGSTLVVSVDHRGGDWLYPLMVDPVVVEDQRYWRTNSGLDYVGWQYAESPSSTKWAYYYGDSYLGRGVYLYSRDLWYFNNLDYAAWYFQAPGDAYFYKAEFGYVEHEPDWQTLVSEGFWLPSSATWQTGWASNQGSITGQPNVSPISNSGPMGYISTTHCVSGSNCSSGSGTSGNQVRFLLWTSPAGNRSDFTAYMGGAAGWLSDRTAPYGRVLDLSGISEGVWYDVESFSATVRGSDGGLGVKQFKLKVPGYADRLRTHNCAGHRLDRCPRNLTTWSSDSRVSGDSFIGFDTAQMPQGYQTVSGQVADFVGNWSSSDTGVLQVDHSAPTVAFSDSLYDHRDQTVDHGIYKVRATATDPYSGVTNVRILLDGTELANVSQDPCDGCSLIAEATVATYALPPGRHDVVAFATDRLGHVSTTESFAFYTPEGTPCPLNPFVDQPPLGERPLESLGLCANWPLS